MIVPLRPFLSTPVAARQRLREGDGWHGNCIVEGVNRKSPICTLKLSAPDASPAVASPVEAPPAPVPESGARKRLARGFARLQNIDLVRNHLGNADFGKWAENRIIWRELLELELQRILGEDAAGQSSTKREAQRKP